ncbi:DUF3455 domain-containing protein [Burkholderia sp. SCN-KJ]|uniref:DUF3455 domain-containing protein n=1 Tax=Burkholderia sp. SCN-KJ TaxID=2969248 RepID=UPI0021501254|nr:DUF3455 domain-containing protein [Burkholderia sp. SCN-KJ]MCR4468315.1 DUF3455 domain-containing protein [Burkholderia sp. SCN-KJ]
MLNLRLVSIVLRTMFPRGTRSGTQAGRERMPQALRALAGGALLASLAACTAPLAPPADTDLPSALRAGPGRHLDEVLTARGQTIYECRRNGAEQSWVREGELATLVDSQRRSVGTVAPGGYFTAYDDSYVVTRADSVAQVTAGTLTWVRLVARDKRGSQAQTGRFARTSVIQQVNTTGGLPPVPLCDREGGTLLVPYSAAYLMYSEVADGQPAQAGQFRAAQSPSADMPQRANGATPLPTD